MLMIVIIQLSMMHHRDVLIRWLVSVLSWSDDCRFRWGLNEINDQVVMERKSDAYH